MGDLTDHMNAKMDADCYPGPGGDAPRHVQQPTIAEQAPTARAQQPGDFARGEAAARRGDPCIVPGDLAGLGGEWIVGYMLAAGRDPGCRFV